VDFLPPVVAHLIADIGEFTAGFGAAKAELTGFEAAQTRMAAAGKVAMGALAIGVAAVGYESVKMAASFGQSMELIHTQAGASQAEVDGLKKKVLDLAPAVGMGPEKLAEGLYHVESAGFRGAQALDITAAAAKDAAIGMGAAETVTQALIGTMASGIGGVRDAADAAAYLNTIVGIGDMRMEKLAAAISTDNATPADEAATRLRMTVSLMAAPSGVATKALASIGIGQHQLADDLRKPDGLLVAVMDLKDHLEASGKTASEQNAIIQHAFGGGKTSGAILTLLEESDRLKDKYHELGDSASRAGKFQDAWQSQQQQFTQQLHQLGAAAQVVGIQIGSWIIPKLQGAAEWMGKHTEVVKIAAVIIGGVLVAAMMAWTAAVIANGIAMMANPTTWIILAIIAAVALLAIGIYELVKHWDTVWNWIKHTAETVWNALVAGWHWLADTASNIWNNYIVGPIVTAWHTVGHWIDNAVSWFAALPGRIGAGLAALPGRLETLITQGMHRFIYLIGWGIGYTLRLWIELPPKIWHIITSLWDGAVQLVATGVHNIITWFTEMRDRAVHNVEQWWNDIVARIELGIHNAGKWLHDLPHNVAKIFDEVRDWASERIWNMVNNVENYLHSLPGKARDAIHELPGKILEVVSDAGHWLWDAGTHLVQGLINGVKSMWSSAINSVKNFGHDLVSGFKDALGIHSPSLAFALAGRNVVDGFAKGITDNAATAIGAITQLGAGVTLTPRLSFTAGGELSRDMIVGLRSGSSATANAAAVPVGQGVPAPSVIHSHLYIDGKELHARLVPHAQRYKQRNGTTGLG